MKKILLVCKAWPELSQTYIRNEVNALREFGLDVFVLCIREAKEAASDAPGVSFSVADDWAEQRKKALQFSPDWIHAHYITMAPLASQLSRTCECPFSVRTHSFDVLGQAAKSLGDQNCGAVFCYPFARNKLKHLGIEDKLIDYFPLKDLPEFATARAGRTGWCTQHAGAWER